MGGRRLARVAAHGAPERADLERQGARFAARYARPSTAFRSEFIRAWRSRTARAASSVRSTVRPQASALTALFVAGAFDTSASPHGVRPAEASEMVLERKKSLSEGGAGLDCLAQLLSDHA